MKGHLIIINGQDGVASNHPPHPPHRGAENFVLSEFKREPTGDNMVTILFKNNHQIFLYNLQSRAVRPFLWLTCSITPAMTAGGIAHVKRGTSGFHLRL